MRFRANIVNVTLLKKLCATVKVASKQCVLLLSPDLMKIIVETPISDGTSVWATMPTKALLDVTILKSATDNAIALRLSAEHLEKAAKSGDTAQNFYVRLRKRDSQPVLSFTAEVLAPQPMTVTQDVPCAPLGARAIEALTEPDLPQPDSAIILPDLKQFKNVVDHLSNIADQLTLSTSSDGVFTLEASTPNVTVTTTYSCMPYPLSRASSAAPSAASSQVGGSAAGTPVKPPSTPAAAGTAVGDPPVGTPASRKTFTANVTAAKLAKFLPCSILGPKQVMCCIVEQYSIVMHAVIGDLTVTYYIPVLCS